jgi:hypothetical protein
MQLPASAREREAPLLHRITPGHGMPPIAVLRAALYRQAFIQVGPGSDPGAPLAPALA